MRKLKILFFAEAVTLAHISRIITFASKLDRNLYEPYLACSNNFPLLVQNFHGNIFHLTSRTPKEFHQLLANGEILFDDKILNNYVYEEIKIIENVLPDIIVGDLRPSLSVSAELANIPYINLTNAYWSPYSSIQNFPMPPLEKISKLIPKGWIGNKIISFLEILGKSKSKEIQLAQGKGINQIRLKHGLKPFENYLEGFVYGNFTAYADLPEVVKCDLLPSNHKYIGPLEWSPDIPLPSWCTDAFLSEPFIYVCLGSSGWQKLLPLVVNTLIRKGHKVAVSTSGYQTTLTKHKNLFVADFLPGNKICPAANLVICNGGSPSVYQALLHGVPVIGLPANMDQLLFMQHVESENLGIMLRADTVNKSQILRATNTIIKDSTYRIKALAVKNSSSKFLDCDPINSILKEITANANHSAVQNM
jgi:UDP:flavonoid glycosyltransferase YjiC (YdhE family)